MMRPVPVVLALALTASSAFREAAEHVLAQLQDHGRWEAINTRLCLRRYIPAGTHRHWSWTEPLQPGQSPARPGWL